MTLIGETIVGESLVEVRMPTYKRPVLLKRALLSIVAQTHRNWRCIVLDDDSSGDESKHVCQAVGDPRIIYRKNICNLGVGRNIDQAFALAPLPEATHACVLEDDNYFLPELMRENLKIMQENSVDIVLRNQLIERPTGPDVNGTVGPSTSYEHQYKDGLMCRKDLWSSFFYCTAANNSSLFWKLKKGISFSTSTMSDDPVFQERLRTLCIDRKVYLAFDPLVVWRDNGADSFRPKTRSYFGFLLSQTKAAARERALYQQLYMYLESRGCLDLVFHPRHRKYDGRCERVFARCGIKTPNAHRHLDLRTRLRIRVLRWIASCAALAVAEPIKYRLGHKRIEPQ